MPTSEYKMTLARVFAEACVHMSPTMVGRAVIQTPRDRRHGDYACPAALQLASAIKRPPRDIAAELLQNITLPDFVATADIAGAGYINIRLKTAAKLAVIGEVLRAAAYGRAADNRQTVLLEFVSANPTGPLHIGHGRAAAFGDSLANIMEFAGYQVRREYYVNDAGRQSDILAASLWLRHFLSAANSTAAMPAGAYQGDYLLAILPAARSSLAAAAPPPNLDALLAKLAAAAADDAADILVAAMRESLRGDTEEFSSVVAATVLAGIKNDLAGLGVRPFDCWFSEKTLHADGNLAAAIDALRRHNPGNIYRQDGALWFRSSAYGDDKDRVLCRANGQYTYFAADIAYHHNKLNRPLDAGRHYRLINILGADHHGYVPRLAAAVAGLSNKADLIETRLIQFVALVYRGQRAKMSTRSGQFVPLAVLIDEIGRDAARYFYVCRKNDQHLDVDIALASEKNNKNPVYYLQYAHARAAGIFRKWGGCPQTLADAACAPLAEHPAALELCALLAAFPETVIEAAQERTVHPLAVFLQELATAMHTYYEKTRILNQPADKDMPARLAVLAAAQTVLRNGLNLLGITAPERM